MTAEEMFMVLGYEKKADSDKNILFSYNPRHENSTVNPYVVFWKNNQTIDTINVPAGHMIAILYQCKELGWISKEEEE